MRININITLDWDRKTLNAFLQQYPIRNDKNVRTHVRALCTMLLLADLDSIIHTGETQLKGAK